MDAKTMTMPNGDIINLMDEEARNILGDETLDTTAQTCTGAINELKGTLDEKVDTSVINNNTIVIPTAGTNITIEDGGYTRIGSLVILNIRIKATANIAPFDIILSGMPYPKNRNGLNIAGVSSNTATFTSAFVEYGNIKLTGGTSIAANEIRLFHAVYVTY